MTTPDPFPRDLRAYSVALALEIGEPAAQMFHRIWCFCARTQSGKVVDGRRWIRNSFLQWREDHFPHWSLNTVKRAVQVLTGRGLILKANHNQVQQNRTLWYAINFEHPLLPGAGYIDHKPLAQNGSMHRPKRSRCIGSKRVDRKGQKESMHRPKKSPSIHRNSSERFNQEDSSSSHRSEDDGHLQKSQEKARARDRGEGHKNNPVPADSGNQENVLSLGRELEYFEPPPGAPPCLPPEKIYALFGGPGPRPRNLLACPEGDFVLRDLTAPFKKGPEVKEVIGFDPDTLQEGWFEESLELFSKEAFDRHWNKKSDPPGSPFKRLFYQVGRSGLLHAFGFHPLSPEQQEMRRRELERQEEEAAEAARIREEKDDKFCEFINRTIVKDYLLLKRFRLEEHEAIKAHLREVTAQFNGQATLTAVEGFMQEEIQNAKAVKRRREQVRELRRLAEEDPRLIEGFVQKGIISETDDFIFSDDACLDLLLDVGQELQIEGLCGMTQAFISQTQG